VVDDTAGGREAKRSAGTRAQSPSHRLEDVEEHVIVQAADQVVDVAGPIRVARVLRRGIHASISNLAQELDAFI